MAALIIAGGLAIADKIERKKQARKDKKAHDERRYQELQAETKAMASGRRDSVNAGSDSETEASAHRRVDREAPRAPPSYNEAVGTGTRPR
ncbi:hypothetical protein LTR53_013065 [Teratosphaeriaceae sp. CCFEE 6253]|nr:hypothetical protein LTR53_013065 [Teratosphaeriaceae sp. CCFEE 6253]